MGADVSLVSARLLRPGIKYLPWSERDGRTRAVAQPGIAVLERAVLEVQLGPVRALTPFVVALGVGFDATLGVGFLDEHGISVNLAQHCFVFEAHDGLIVPLVGHHRRLKHACTLTHDVALYPGGRALVRGACERPGGEEDWTPARPRCIPDFSAERPKLGSGGAGTAGDRTN